MYSWGVGPNGASREAEHDALLVEVPVNQTDSVIEQFTIALVKDGVGAELKLTWDRTEVIVPLELN